MPASIFQASLFQPLGQARFRRLWLANLLSNIGSWAQLFGATWQVSTLSHSAMATALVQTATWAPMLLCALPAGLLADTMHKPRLLFRCNALMSLVAAGMALLTMAGTPSPTVVLLLTFVMGAGAALALPAWHASMAEQVAPNEMPAVAALNNFSYNLAALAGPCLGGLLLQLQGPAALYAFNALSFCGLLWLYRQWRRQEHGSVPLERQAAAALLQGIAASWRSPSFRALLLHTPLIFCASIALPALLPSLARELLRLDASDFGLLMGAFGAGAMLGAVLLLSWRRQVSQRCLLSGALAVYAVMLALVGVAQALSIFVPLVACCGAAWSAIATTLNRAALASFPGAMRTRTLSMYLLVAAAGQTVGSALWGQLAIHFGIVATMLGAAGALLVCAALPWCSTDYLEQK